jgi:hypothetical protein
MVLTPCAIYANLGLLVFLNGYLIVKYFKKFHKVVLFMNILGRFVILLKLWGVKSSKIVNRRPL